ncbi:cohesin subunit SA-1 isoform X2 [Cynoglossus semilaevis]|uniref:cohesin subunit SA-1 isoform X2 n=1 Tax=Cynoglossus semilaevis TaxID=244447 RepID=UPI000495D875|nr:cohesin subunit SA-3 isoform X2 [Cynoglossus semilaevis]XP_016894975.1 cohesin subunit SA-3 isoform X2 [Cynoglossus semilaevis]
MAPGTVDIESPDELDDFPLSANRNRTPTISTKRKKRRAPPPQPPKRPRRQAASRVTRSLNDSSLGPTSNNSSLQQQQKSQRNYRRPASIDTNRESERKEAISAKDIFDAVSSGKTAMVALVDEWLDCYKQNRENGLLVLYNFIVQSCGCKGVISREMLDKMENAKIIGTLTKEFNEDSVIYPLSTPSPQLKHFRAGLYEFAKVLVHSCQNSIIYDEYLFQSLLSLLTGMSDSQVRAFRHTSTLLAMRLMTGLVEVAVTVCDQLQTTQRRYDTEKNKRANDRAVDRLNDLQVTINELVEKKEDLSAMINSTFRGVFVHRYRDKLADIRVSCISELGVWMKINPEKFLDDSYLKYLGWTLYDKQSPVRLQCVRALQGLYQDEKFSGHLELFTSRFKERMLCMVQDKDSDVAVEVVRLLLMIQQDSEEALTEEDCGCIYPVIYTIHRGLASAAGAFLYNKLKSLSSQNRTDNEKGQKENFFQMLISFFIQSEFHEHATYLVDSLWDVAGSEMRDWDNMTSLLLHDTRLMDEEETALIDVMMCAMRQAAQATPPVGRSQSKKVQSKKDRTIQEQDKRRITTHFIPLLSQLLEKYSADAGKVSLLLRAPLYFNLEMYNSAQRMEKHLDQLLSQVCGILEKHTAGIVLEACTYVVNVLCSNAYTFSSRANLVFSQLMDSLVERFNTYLSDLLEGTAEENDMCRASNALKRISALSGAKDPTGWKLFDSCVKLLQSMLESRELNTELMVSLLRFAFLHLSWARVNAETSNLPEADLKQLRREMRLFCRICQTCLPLPQSTIRDQAFELLCDLLLLFSQGSIGTNQQLQALVHLPSDSLRSEMASFLMEIIFNDSDDAELHGHNEEEMRITLLQRKRNQLAGYCKLIIYRVLDLVAATDVFKHFSTHFKDFGDIIKETINKSKLINPVQSAKTVCLTLQQLFSEMEDKNRKNLGELRDLGKMLALTFGPHLHRVREPLVTLHMDGIRFGLRVPEDGEDQDLYVLFLEVLSEFSLKLLPQDGAQLAAYFKSECPSAALSWPSTKVYLRSLETRSTRPREQKRVGDAGSSGQTPVAKRRRKVVPQVSKATGGSFLDSSSIPSILPTPAEKSTMIKKPNQKLPRSPSLDSGGITEVDSEDDFPSVPQMRKAKPVKRLTTSSSQANTSTDAMNLNSHLTLLSLIEDDQTEQMEEDDIEEYDSDSDHGSSYILPSTRHTPVSVLDELFD